MWILLQRWTIIQCHSYDRYFGLRKNLMLSWRYMIELASGWKDCIPFEWQDICVNRQNVFTYGIGTRRKCLIIYIHIPASHSSLTVMLYCCDLYKETYSETEELLHWISGLPACWLLVQKNFVNAVHNRFVTSCIPTSVVQILTLFSFQSKNRTIHCYTAQFIYSSTVFRSN